MPYLVCLLEYILSHADLQFLYHVHHEFCNYKPLTFSMLHTHGRAHIQVKHGQTAPEPLSMNSQNKTSQPMLLYNLSHCEYRVDRLVP